MEKQYELKDTDVVIDLDGLSFDTLNKLDGVVKMVQGTTKLTRTTTHQIEQNGVYVPIEQHSYATLILHNVSQKVVDKLDEIFKREV